MNEIESCAWSSFVLVVKNFLGNKKADNYTQLVEDMLFHTNRLGCNMSVKVHYLHSYLDRIQEILGDLTLRLLMSYIYGAPILDVSRSHTMTHHSR